MANEKKWKKKNEKKSEKKRKKKKKNKEKKIPLYPNWGGKPFFWKKNETVLEIVSPTIICKCF